MDRNIDFATLLSIWNELTFKILKKTSTKYRLICCRRRHENENAISLLPWISRYRKCSLACPCPQCGSPSGAQSQSSPRPCSPCNWNGKILLKMGDQWSCEKKRWINFTIFWTIWHSFSSHFELSFEKQVHFLWL